MTIGIAMMPGPTLAAVAASPIPPATLATVTGLGLLDMGAALAVAAAVVLLVRVARDHRAASRTGRVAITEPRLAA